MCTCVRAFACIRVRACVWVCIRVCARAYVQEGVCVCGMGGVQQLTCQPDVGICTAKTNTLLEMRI